MEKKVVNLNDYFTEENEKKGIWVSPVIDGEKLEIELLVTGANDNRNAANADRYSKKLAELEDVKDLEEKRLKKKDLDAERCADFVSGIRAVGGAEIEIDGKVGEYSKEMIIKFFRNAPLVQNWVLEFAYNTVNFMKGKKKNSK